VSTIDQIQTLRQILEKTLEFQIETHHLFIDFKTAYDKFNRNQLYKTMQELSIPPKLVRLTQATMEGTTAKVNIQNELSGSFHVRNGLRQGDVLACVLFNIALEKIICELNINQCGNIFYKSVQILAYANDSFVYLGALITADNNISTKISNRITLANRSYFGMVNKLKAKNINRKHTVTIYKTLIKPVLMYGVETVF
jgi:hypothetical protein